MEALWNLEDKWKLATQEAFLIFVCTAFAVVGLCATAIQEEEEEEEQSSREAIYRKTNWFYQRSGWGSMKKALISSVRWSRANKWEETDSRNWRQTTAPPLLAGRRGGSEALESGCWSHNSVSPVWQRPILMEEKCELPRFSGLILYDEQGRSLHRSDRGTVQQSPKSCHRHHHLKQPNNDHAIPTVGFKFNRRFD
ncbi:hypothetical protein BVC80_8695g6 [Macleaya cordata]|uniref:Uncharacterized protein n=1 Tax=Macleaya cordata TaxID=56857 RepID=A0A200PPQ8_MACCD|nr:hypothetical protein BVC80_8695g6 [Macleaya cordata]